MKCAFAASASSVTVLWLLLFAEQPADVDGQQVVDTPGFPKYVAGEATSVTWDGRSLLLNGERAIFVSGSIHPPRQTRSSWDKVLEDAVAQGLNMVEVYVFWNVHQPTKEVEPEFEDLGRVIEMCGARGLWVTLRVGPYVCAEWDYGGIPVWVGLEPGMVMRAWNEAWMAAMGEFEAKVVEYARPYFAHRGGPIVLAQIENELEVETEEDMQYVQWCGDLANSLEPSAAWIMCNGDSANNTINTCNGEDCVEFLESHGQNGRVLVDQPALWTENEGGYQIWGESKRRPTDYFWGRTAANLAYATLRWFARGGTHVNYYMWAGGSNFGRFAGAGITNAYAYDVVLCPNGQRHQPKYDHLRKMHAVLKSKAPQVLGRVPLPQTLENGLLVFEFSEDCVFVESNSSRVAYYRGEAIQPESVVIFDQYQVLFDSSYVPAAKYERVDTVVVANLTWSHYREGEEGDWVRGTVEQSVLTLGSPTQYAWYAADNLSGSELVIETDHANAWVAFVDGDFVDAVDDHSHDDGPLNVTLRVVPGSLRLLSESLGFHNLIGRWGASRTAKKKGIVGRVFLDGEVVSPDHFWSKAGLAGPGRVRRKPGAPATWSIASFNLDTASAAAAAVPLPPEGLMMDAAGLGRGHFWVNGHDAGRFWNIRDDLNQPTQRYYHIPADWLRHNNRLVIFDALGGDPTSVALIDSRVVPSNTPNMPDVIDSKRSCLI